MNNQSLINESLGSVYRWTDAGDFFIDQHEQVIDYHASRMSGSEVHTNWRKIRDAIRNRNRSIDRTAIQVRDRI